MSSKSKTKTRNDYTIGIITALAIERASITVMLDERHEVPSDFRQSQSDPNSYTWGSIGDHNVIITSLGSGVYGSTMATTTAIPLLSSFLSIKFGLMVGIGAGVPGPSRDIRLGDVVVGQPMSTSGGVFQYDLGKAIHNQWERKDFLNRPPDILLKALANLQAEHEIYAPQAISFLQKASERYDRWGASYNRPEDAVDRLFASSYPHQTESATANCSECDIHELLYRNPRSSNDFQIHYGIIASGNSLVKDALVRDWIVSMEEQCICIEMEAAGLMNSFPCLVIRGICDYADTHKNDLWQRYASATAAAFAKELLTFVPITDVATARRATDIVNDTSEDTAMLFQHIQDAHRWSRTDMLTSILQSLATSPYSERKDRNSCRAPGTCVWFTDHTLFRKWQEDDGFSILWASADPGCGKSVLARYLVDEVLPNPNTVLLYFFFKDDLDDQRTANHAISAMLHQLIEKHNNHIPENILQRFLQQGSSMSQSFPVLWQLFLSTIGIIPEGDITCIFDAIDECEETSRLRLFENMNKLQVQMPANTKLKILVTGRPYEEIERSYRRLQMVVPTIRLQGEEDIEVKKISLEIDIVIKNRVILLGKEKGLLDEEVKFLQDKLVAVPNRTYLWVSLVIDLITKTPGFSKGNVKRTITVIPETVDNAYEKMLSRAQDIFKAKRMLCMVLAATRPLTVTELAVALAIQPDHKSIREVADYLEPQSRLRKTLRDICGLCISIVGSEVFLFHQTVKDFLLRSHSVSSGLIPAYGKIQGHLGQASFWKQSLGIEQSHAVLADSCVKYMHLYSMPDGDIGLLDYAMRSWMIHTRKARKDCTAETILLAVSLCTPLSVAHERWSHLYCNLESYILHFQVRINDPRRCWSALMVASWFGMTAVMENILVDLCLIDKQDVDGNTALTWAIEGGHLPAIELLIQLGAKYTIRDRRGRTALDHAVESRICRDISVDHSNTSQFRQVLLKHATDLNMLKERGHYGRTRATTPHPDHGYLGL